LREYAAIACPYLKTEEMEMIRCTRLLLVALLLFATVAIVPVQAQDPQQVKSQFLASNPSNGWEYGYLDDNGVFITYNTTFNAGDGVVGWALDHTPGPFGDVTMNYTANPIDLYGLHWEPGQICINASQLGKGTVVRWHAPAAESIRIDTDLVAQMRGMKANVKLIVDGRQLGISAIDGTTAQTPADPLPTLAKSATATISKGSTVDLIVSPGDQVTLGHVSAVITINVIGPNGTVSSKTSPAGTREVENQAKKQVEISMAKEEAAR
jgi:hypothetical protein